MAIVIRSAWGRERRLPPGSFLRGLTHRWPLDSSSVALKSGTAGTAMPTVGNLYGTALSKISHTDAPPFAQSGDVFYESDALTTYCLLSANPFGGGLPSAFSFAMWVNFNSLSSSDGVSADPRIIGFQTDYVAVVIGPGSTGNLGAVEINAGASDRITTEVISLSAWTHVAATWNGTTHQVYLNGVAATMGAAVNAPGGNAGVWGIGCRDQPAQLSPRISNARFADVMLFVGSTLNASEIAQLYGSYFVSDEGEMPALFTAAGGSFIPAWAMNSNLPVLGTGTY